MALPHRDATLSGRLADRSTEELACWRSLSSCSVSVSVETSCPASVSERFRTVRSRPLDLWSPPVNRGISLRNTTENVSRLSLPRTTIQPESVRIQLYLKREDSCEQVQICSGLTYRALRRHRIFKSMMDTSRQSIRHSLSVRFAIRRFSYKRGNFPEFPAAYLRVKGALNEKIDLRTDNRWDSLSYFHFQLP